LLINNKTEEIIKTSASGKLSDEKENINSQSITTVPEIEPKHTNKRTDTFNKVKELQEEGVSSRRAAKILGISRNTVRSYFVQESLSPRISSKSTNIASFTKLILSRLKTRGCNTKTIIDEILTLGYNGGRTQAYYNINTIRAEYKNDIPDFTYSNQNLIPFIKPLGSRELAKYIYLFVTDITDPDERYYLETLLENVPEFRIVRKLVLIFKTMLKRGSGNIQRWIDFIRRSKRKLLGLKTFANGLMQDIKAVENAIRLP
jgi:predicted transcriptional regulator